MAVSSLSYGLRRREFLASLLVGSVFGPSCGLAAPPGLEDVAVIFVGASWCPHCKQAAPVLAAVLQPVGIPVLVASHDGRPILPFATVADAREHPIASEIKRLPTTLIYSRAADGIVAQIEGYGGARRYAGLVTSALKQASGAFSSRPPGIVGGHKQ